jgi:predicted RNA binding protein YcfA (HicA-like mRNA interferase family)
MAFTGGQNFKDGECRLAEESLALSFPNIPRKSHEIWEAGSFFTRGFGQIKSRIHYMIWRHSPLAARIPNRFVKKPQQVIKGLHKLVGLSLVSHGANHDMYQTDAGNKVTIPRHPGDLGRGLFAKIIKQAGLDMSVSEFLRNI